ncbi:hypothetical protein [Streptomyces bicolor]
MGEHAQPGAVSLLQVVEAVGGGGVGRGAGQERGGGGGACGQQGAAA